MAVYIFFILYLNQDILFRIVSKKEKGCNIITFYEEDIKLPLYKICNNSGSDLLILQNIKNNTNLIAEVCF